MSEVAQATRESPVETTGLRPVQAVAEFLAISRSKVYQLMESGELPYVKLGKSRRVRWADVLQLVDENTVSRDRS
jgi:excisionase family DNA binding protein